MLRTGKPTGRKGLLTMSPTWLQSRLLRTVQKAIVMPLNGVRHKTIGVRLRMQFVEVKWLYSLSVDTAEYEALDEMIDT